MLKNTIILIVVFIITGCTGVQYVSIPKYVPLNTHKGELNTTFSLNNFKVGYSLSDYFSIFAIGYFNKRTLGENLLLDGGKENSGHIYSGSETFEANIGVSFFSFKNKFVYEALIGGGYGTLGYRYHVDSREDFLFDMDSKIIVGFIQPNIGIIFNQYVNLAVSFNITGKHYINNSILEMGDMTIQPAEIKGVINEPSINFIFFEPCFTIRAGTKLVKCEFQFIPIFQCTKATILYNNPSVYLGVNVDLNFLNDN